MKNKLLAILLALCLTLSLAAPAMALDADDWEQVDLTEAEPEQTEPGTDGEDDVLASEDDVFTSEEDDGLVETEESAGAPPERFDIYIQAGDYDPILFRSYTGTEMRAIAKLYNPERTALKYSSVSYSGYAGRLATEYITIDDLLEYMSDDDEPVSLGSGDYLIMGEDLTKNQSYIDAGYDRSQLMGNWYSYDSVVGADRYYFPGWSQGSSAGAVKVPAVIGLKSYGASNGVTDELLGYYKSSADYLWAYVLYFGQSSCSEMTYAYFYYGQTQAIIRYDGDTELNHTLSGMLADEIARAQELKDNTVAAASANEVAQGKFWVTQAQFNKLDSALTAASAAGKAENAKNGEVYAALLSLTKQCDEFEAARQSGARSGYFWYIDNDTDTYVITTAQQLIELGKIVRGEGIDTGTQTNLDQDGFAGKTVLLACDIDLGGYIVNIGNAEYAFNGTFDGQGYTVSGLDLYYNSRDYVGLFGNIGPNGIVKNFTASGSVTVNRGWSYVGGVAAKNSGVIEGVRCAIDVETSGSGASGSYVGGIAGYNDGTVRSCVYTGTITAGGDFDTGDTVGYNAGTVYGCIAENSIAGANMGTISGCITTRGPLAVSNGAAIKSSYTLYNNAANTVSDGGSFEDVYCLAESSSASGVTAIASPAGFESEAVLAALNKSGSFKAVEGGYPCLDWQRVYEVYFELFLTGSTMEPVQVGEYLPVIRPADPQAMTAGGTGEPVADENTLFAGWYADEARTQEYDFASLIEGGTTLYARWTDKSGSTIYMLRINSVRHTGDGIKTTTETYFHAEGSSYSHEMEKISFYAADTPVVTGVMGGADTTVEVHYYHLGDVNMDGRVNAIDAMLALRAGSSLIELNDTQTALADVDESGDLSSDDAIIILRYAIGMRDAI